MEKYILEFKECKKYVCVAEVEICSEKPQPEKKIKSILLDYFTPIYYTKGDKLIINIERNVAKVLAKQHNVEEVVMRKANNNTQIDDFLF